jgi:hypothetical protein
MTLRAHPDFPAAVTPEIGAARLLVDHCGDGSMSACGGKADIPLKIGNVA